MAWPPAERSGDLPFMIDDITPRDLRVPSGDAARHANGVTGVRSLVIAVRDLDEASEEFAAVTGAEPLASGSDPDLKADTRTFPAGKQTLILAYPTAPSSPLASRIQRMGDGPYQAIFGTDQAHPTQITPEQAHGARFALEANG